MNRTAIMTTGFLLIFAGIQFRWIESYALKPEASRYWADRWTAAQVELRNIASSFDSDQSQSPYYQASYSVNPYPSANRQSQVSKVIAPPRWICWPVLFLGAVLFIHGLSMSRE
jgi:hypothetical protein